MKWEFPKWGPYYLGYYIRVPYFGNSQIENFGRDADTTDNPSPIGGQNARSSTKLVPCSIACRWHPQRLWLEEFAVEAWHF